MQHLLAKNVADEAERPPWLHLFAGEAKIWTQNGSFENPNSVYVPDDGDLKQIFQNNGVFFAWRPEKGSFSDREALYRSFGLPYLSESVDISLAQKVEHDKVDPDYLTQSAKILIATWIREKSLIDYERLLEKGVLLTLWNTTEARAWSEPPLVYNQLSNAI